MNSQPIKNKDSSNYLILLPQSSNNPLNLPEVYNPIKNDKEITLAFSEIDQIAPLCLAGADHELTPISTDICRIYRLTNQGAKGLYKTIRKPIAK